MWKVIACVSFLAFVSGANEVPTTEVTACQATQAPLPIYVYVEGCEIPTCRLSSSTGAVVHVVFRAPRTMRSMSTKARAWLTGVQTGIDYDLGDDAVTCNFLTNSFCPVLENEVIMYTLRMPLQRIWAAAGTVTLEFRVEDEATEQSAFCFRVPIQVLLF